MTSILVCKSNHTCSGGWACVVDSLVSDTFMIRPTFRSAPTSDRNVSMDCSMENANKPQVHQGVLIFLQYNSQSMTTRLPITHGPFQQCTRASVDSEHILVRRQLGCEILCYKPQTPLLRLPVRSTNITISKFSGRRRPEHRELATMSPNQLYQKSIKSF